MVSTAERSNNHGFARLNPKQLEEKNYSTWQRSVLLTLKTLKLLDHLQFDKAPPQYEEISESEAESGSVTNTNKNAAQATPTNPKTSTPGKKIIQESQKYLDWMQNDCALMT
ncbi:hypothetical protein PIB30_057042 [Stylosanthes scabra]|uniref:Retrotransposon Copia-like N-terminal domain-containing protein n=1 Tax=Stylosanthes scabra TaxID=79078 RepID=A0ABU6VJT0_9FABA|nr:hypothetical protein [Stylosanthes scabra]